jgi:hypothetical protein
MTQIVNRQYKNKKARKTNPCGWRFRVTRNTLSGVQPRGYS